jgi:hypothetical protein
LKVTPFKPIEAFPRGRLHNTSFSKEKAHLAFGKHVKTDINDANGGKLAQLAEFIAVNELKTVVRLSGGCFVSVTRF